MAQVWAINLPRVEEGGVGVGTLWFELTCLILRLENFHRESRARDPCLVVASPLSSPASRRTSPSLYNQNTLTVAVPDPEVLTKIKSK
jgi:hypothetical protein